MASEIITTGATGYSIQSEILSRFMQPAIYALANVLPTARIDSPEGPSLDKRYTKHPTLSDASVGEIASISNSAWSPSQQSVSTSRYGIALEFGDLWAMGSVVNGAEIAAQASNAVRNGIDTRLAATFANFTPAVNRTGAQFRLQDFISAQYEIENRGLEDRGPIVCALAPIQIQDLRNSIRTETGAVLGQDNKGDAAGLFDLGDMWSLNGVAIVSTRNAATANTDTDRVGAMYPAGQLGPILYQEKRAAMPEFDRSVRTSSTVVVTTAYYGVANLFLTEGVKITSRATA